MPMPSVPTRRSDTRCCPRFILSWLCLLTWCCYATNRNTLGRDCLSCCWGSRCTICGRCGRGQLRFEQLLQRRGSPRLSVASADAVRTSAKPFLRPVRGETRFMTDLFAKKPLDLLLEEARETGEHSLKRTLGVFQLTALGVGAVIGAGIFVLSGLGAHYAGPGLMLSFVLSGMGCAFAGLCYAEFAAMIPLAGSAYTYAYATLGELFAWIIGWDLTLEYAMGASAVSSGWSNHFIELLAIFHIKMPLWLAYDHWTGLHTAENIVARQMAQASDSTLVPGTQGFLNRVTDIMSGQSAELVQRGHDLLNAPHLFGYEIGINVPAFIIALVITAILVVGIKESARFNATIVTIKVAVVIFVIGLGFRYVSAVNC